MPSGRPSGRFWTVFDRTRTAARPILATDRRRHTWRHGNEQRMLNRDACGRVPAARPPHRPPAPAAPPTRPTMDDARRPRGHPPDSAMRAPIALRTTARSPPPPPPAPGAPPAHHGCPRAAGEQRGGRNRVSAYRGAEPAQGPIGGDQSGGPIIWGSTRRHGGSPDPHTKRLIRSSYENGSRSNPRTQYGHYLARGFPFLRVSIFSYVLHTVLSYILYCPVFFFLRFLVFFGVLF